MASILNGCRENRTASGKNFSRSRGSIWRTERGSIYAGFSTDKYSRVKAEKQNDYEAINSRFGDGNFGH